MRSNGWSVALPSFYVTPTKDSHASMFGLQRALGHSTVILCLFEHCPPLGAVTLVIGSSLEFVSAK